MFQSIASPYFIITLIAMVVSLVIHEFAHAFVADVLGDKTARLSGRLTLNPVAHFELLGLILILFAPIGWARPVPINPGNFRKPRLGLIVTSLAGPASNFVLACICYICLRMFPGVAFNQFLTMLLAYGAAVNVNLCVFNLIPIPPLDGSRVVGNLLPYRQAVIYEKLEVYGPFILLFGVMVAGRFLLNPLFASAQSLVASWFGFRPY